MKEDRSPEARSWRDDETEGEMVSAGLRTQIERLQSKLRALRPALGEGAGEQGEHRSAAEAGESEQL